MLALVGIILSSITYYDIFLHSLEDVSWVVVRECRFHCRKESSFKSSKARWTQT